MGTRADRKRRRSEWNEISKDLVEDSILDENSFQWRVAGAGYQWREGDGNPVLYCTGGNGLAPRLYNPLQVGGLFKSFARLAPTQDAYRRFADSYGLLNMGSVSADSQPTCDGDHEPWKVWRKAHEEIRRANGVWEWVERGVISEHLKTGNGPWGEFATSPGAISWHLANPSDASKWCVSFASKEKAPEKAAMQLVQKWVNAGLEEGEGARMRVLWHPDREKYVLRVLPLTLLGCMWWQFARALTGEVKYGECRECGNPLEKGQEAFNETRVFCSAACKQKDHRKRVKQAKELNAAGMSIPKIAKTLGTEPEVIRNWLTKAK